MCLAFRPDAALSFLQTLSHEELLEYARLASIDDRTGLMNLDCFKYSVRHDYGEQAYPLPMLVLDLVGLKRLNGYGREVGNVALRHIGGLVRETTAGTDSRASRIGGDEYAILPPCTVGSLGVPFLRHAIKEIESGLPERVELGKLETRCPEFALELRYGIVNVRSSSPECIDDAINIALKKAYNDVPVTSRDLIVLA